MSKYKIQNKKKLKKLKRKFNKNMKRVFKLIGKSGIGGKEYEAIHKKLVNISKAMRKI